MANNQLGHTACDDLRGVKEFFILKAEALCTPAKDVKPTRQKKTFLEILVASL